MAAHPASHKYFESKDNDFNYNAFNTQYSGNDDEEYQHFLKIRKAFPSICYGKCKVEDMRGSIFSAPADFSFAISVSADLKMNSGIAIKFKERYSCVEIFKEQNAKTGGLAFVKHRDTERFIYYLVVMPVHNARPTYYTIWMAMQKLKENVLENKIKKIAMSHIGCDIDASLTWKLVKPMIEYIFRDVSIEINAYKGKSPCMLNHDLEDCYCFGYCLQPPQIQYRNGEHFNYFHSGMLWGNKYFNYNRQGQKNNNNYFNQAKREDLSKNSSVVAKGNFWDHNEKDFCKSDIQGQHSVCNTFNTQAVIEVGSVDDEDHYHIQQEEDICHKYFVKIGNNCYVKCSTEDAANDYYGALY